MPPSSRIPPLLQPHVRLPRDESIVLLTSTLGASANWLITRFISDALNFTNGGVATRDGAVGGDAGPQAGKGDSDDVNVVLVSWMRPYDFWRQEARKGGGVDLERARREGRVGFVDGLSGLFLPLGDEGRTGGDVVVGGGGGGEEVESRPAARMLQSPSLRGPTPGRIGGVPARGPPISSQAPASSPPAVRHDAQSTTAKTLSNSNTSGLYTLNSPDLAHLKSTITTALSHLAVADSSRKILLILDNPDVLLATTSGITPSSLSSLVLTLQDTPNISHILVHLQADTPLLGINIPLQPIEIAQRNTLVKMAHMSRRVLSVRVLDTGVARDVSGVLRATENERELARLSVRKEGENEDEGKGREMLYKVNGDGSVKVFERGAGGEG